MTLTPPELEELIGDVLERCAAHEDRLWGLQLEKSTLADHNGRWTTRMPIVQEFVKSFMGKE